MSNYVRLTARFDLFKHVLKTPFTCGPDSFSWDKHVKNSFDKSDGETQIRTSFCFDLSIELFVFMLCYLHSLHDSLFLQ